MKIDREEIALGAKRLRNAYGIQTNGISDIFSFVNQQGIELIRYPFGRNTLLGFSTFYEGKKIIVSNSSEILAREIYTVAHELGHIIYDFCDNASGLKIDKHTENAYPLSLSETQAFYFADCLLMPEDCLQDVIKNILKKKPEDLRAINIVQMQLEFKVSFNALIRRLQNLGMISEDKKDQLYKERTFYTSKKLFELLGADEELLISSEKLVIPPKYIDFVISNYENKYIPLASLKKALHLLGMDTSDWKEKISDDEEESIDDLFGEYE